MSSFRSGKAAGERERSRNNLAEEEEETERERMRTKTEMHLESLKRFAIEEPNERWKLREEERNGRCEVNVEMVRFGGGFIIVMK